MTRWAVRTVKGLVVFVYRPKSFFKLVLIGFILVALPLLVAIVGAILYVNRLVELSQQTVSYAVEVTEGSRMLSEQLVAMERSARQYQVLRDTALFQVYAETHQKYQQTAERLWKLPLDEYQKNQLKVLIEKEQNIFAVFRAYPRNSGQINKAIPEFASLAELAKSLVSRSSQLIDRETHILRQSAVKAQEALIWQALALVPGATIFAVVFVMLISRPIRQIDLAIRRIGDGDFTSSVAVKGPRDLEYLGEQLNWLRQRLQELEQEKQKFLRHVSHELKTPLTAIREGTELLTDGIVGELNSEQEEIARILELQSRNLQRLIEDLLNFSMMQEKHTSFDINPIQLNRLIEDVVTDHKPVIMAKRIDLALLSPEILVFGDHEKLRIVIDNLLSNAVKFSPEGGKIIISLQRSVNVAVLDVIDSGPGVDEKEREKVFNAFYQGSAIPDGPVKGSGLGLAIAREYLIAHNGRIEIVDDILQGAHFRAVIPFNLRD
jgi:two-component system sensor histidine kinase GlrK